MRQIFPSRPSGGDSASLARTQAGRERLDLLLEELNRPLTSHPTASRRRLRGYFSRTLIENEGESPALASARAAARAALGCEAPASARQEADALLAASMHIPV